MMTISSCNIKLDVVCQSVSIVAPAHPVPPYSYFLSNLDLHFASSLIYMQGVYYFRTKKNDSRTPSIESLKDSLSKVLSIYPIFAGRLKTKAEAGGRMEVDVNGEGVPFIEAITNAKLDDWPDLHVCDIEEQLNPKDLFVTNIFTAPLIRVQFTTFGCGGMALGFSSLHVISDGLATMEFLKTWGEIHRGVQISTPPRFESIILRSRDPPAVKVPLADELFSACKPVNMSTPYPDLLIQLDLKSIRCKNIVFRIERHMINRCIGDVESGAFACGPSSSFEAISALFWVAVTRARGLDDTATTTYIFPVSVRGKCDPPLPRGYFGNAVIMNQATATAKHIKSNHISFAASLIHKRLQMVNPELIQSAIDWMEVRLKQQQEIGVGFDISTGSNMISSSFANFPVYEINFGRKVDQFVFTMGDSSSPVDGLLYVLPAPPNASEGSREVKLRLREDHLERLLRDSQFAQYFSSKDRA